MFYVRPLLRKLVKQRDYTLLNVLGLGLSVGCCILIFMLLRHHLRFDTYHKNADRTMRVVMDVKSDTYFPFSGVPLPMAEALRNDCAFVEKAAMRADRDEALISIANQTGTWDKYREKDAFAWVEPSYFDILDLPLIQGNTSDLSQPNTVVISERTAHKYFGDAPPLGKILRFENKADLRVVGVLQNLPRYTDYKQEILGSWATLNSFPEFSSGVTSWAGASGGNFCLALLKDGHSFGEMDAVMTDFRQRYPHPEAADLFQYKALPMLGMHFDTDYGFGTDKKFLWALGLIGLFLLIAACVNFVNMATAQALTRGREVGVRKSLGSTRSELFWHFMGETALITVVSLLVGIFLAWCFLPYLNSWLKEELAFERSSMGILVLFITGLGIVLTFLAGFYPGWMQSRFNPIVSLRNNGELPTKGHFSMRRVLVTTQFVICQILIIGVAVITAQIQFAQDRDWGFRPGAMLTVEIPETEQMQTLKNQLSQISGVKHVSLCYQAPASGSSNQTGIVYDNRPEMEPWMLNNKAADANYLETFDLQLVAGRNMMPSDTVRDIVVNETFVKKLNLASPEEVLNKTLQIGQNKGKVVGVVRDFHPWGLSLAIAPIALSTSSMDYATCAIQLNPGNPAPVLEQIKRVWESHYPNYFYAHRFMDEQLAEFMETETTLLRLIQTFAGVAIFIGCLGLYGLASFMATRKRKEIGVRKVLGASISGILWLFGKEYVRLVSIAIVIASPIAYYFMSQWLADFAYRIEMQWWMFALAGVMAAVIAFLTVGFQSVKAALVNPVKSLRSE